MPAALWPPAACSAASGGGRPGRWQVIDLDPGVVAHLLAGLMLQGGLIIARSDDPDATRATLGPALEAMLRGLAPGNGD